MVPAFDLAHATFKRPLQNHPGTAWHRLPSASRAALRRWPRCAATASRYSRSSVVVSWLVASSRAASLMSFWHKKSGCVTPFSASPSPNPGIARCATLHLPVALAPAASTHLQLQSRCVLPCCRLCLRFGLCCLALPLALLLGGGRAFLRTKAPTAAALGESCRAASEVRTDVRLSAQGED